MCLSIAMLRCLKDTGLAAQDVPEALGEAAHGPRGRCRRDGHGEEARHAPEAADDCETWRCLIRGPQDHMNIRILPSTVSGILLKTRI